MLRLQHTWHNFCQEILIIGVGEKIYSTNTTYKNTPPCMIEMEIFLTQHKMYEHERILSGDISRSDLEPFSENKLIKIK